MAAMEDRVDWAEPPAVMVEPVLEAGTVLMEITALGGAKGTVGMEATAGMRQPLAVVSCSAIPAML